MTVLKCCRYNSVSSKIELEDILDRGNHSFNKEWIKCIIKDDVEGVKLLISNNGIDIFKQNWCSAQDEVWLPVCPWNIAILNGSHKVLELFATNDIVDLHENNEAKNNAVHILIMAASKGYRTEESCLDTYDVLAILITEKGYMAKYLTGINPEKKTPLRLACEMQTLKLMMKIFEYEGVYKFVKNSENVSTLEKEYYDITDFLEINSPFEILSPLDCIHWIRKDKLQEANDIVKKDPLKTWIKVICKKYEKGLWLSLLLRCLKIVCVLITLTQFYPIPRKQFPNKYCWIFPALNLLMSVLGLYTFGSVFCKRINCKYKIDSKHRYQYFSFYCFMDFLMYVGILIFTIFQICDKVYFPDNFVISESVYQAILVVICVSIPWHIFNRLRSSSIRIVSGSYRYIVAIQKMVMVAARFIVILMIIFLPFMICFKYIFSNAGIHSSNEEKYVNKGYVSGVINLTGIENISNTLINITTGNINTKNGEINLVTSDKANIIGHLRIKNHSVVGEKAQNVHANLFKSWSTSMYHTWIIMLGEADMVQNYDIIDRSPTAYILHVLFSIIMSLMVLNFLTALFVNAYNELEASRHAIAASQNLDVIRSMNDFFLKKRFQNWISQRFECEGKNCIKSMEFNEQNFRKICQNVNEDKKKRFYFVCNVLSKNNLEI